MSVFPVWRCFATAGKKTRRDTKRLFPWLATSIVVGSQAHFLTRARAALAGWVAIMILWHCEMDIAQLKLILNIVARLIDTTRKIYFCSTFHLKPCIVVSYRTSLPVSLLQPRDSLNASDFLSQEESRGNQPVQKHREAIVIFHII